MSPFLTPEQQLVRNVEEAARLWQMAGDESRTPEERYCCAWGALDHELAAKEIQEELAKQGMGRAA